MTTNRQPFVLLIAVLLTSAVKSHVVVDSIGDDWDPAQYESAITGPKTCNTFDSLIGDCIDDEEDMESESSRRVLRGRKHKRYISYGALKKNKTPCNRRGQSYYTCAKSGRANPYHRSCTVITRCARAIR
ncbi:Rapid alkalinization factor 2 [Zostera marina]|uniref:Rapid alkalinization factor 2 n=1 Tax=Zostera marina TaxID=29655 RepID=A0A0K9P6N6_ZOSMR|nr:Rapid alkalinization factor 2 [Zostera marina]